MTATTRVLAGDCTVQFEGDSDHTQRGYVVVLVKPDSTVLVHDAGGYQPVAWLTRATEVSVETDGEAFAVTAREDGRTLRVVSEAPAGRRELPSTPAGVPVGDCPDCEGTLVRDGGDVVCVGCDERYGLPTGATVLEKPCQDCGLPTMRVERGEVLEVCIDYACESLQDRVADALDDRWSCPDCGEPLQVRRYDGRAFLGCDGYPDCETAYSIPTGVVADECGCGLPVFETATTRRCLDGDCEHSPAG